MIHLPEAD